jgi:hypothetical protein
LIVSTGPILPINRGLARVSRRADQKSDEHLQATFVDSGVTTALDETDHQVIFGRRGTGKTHAIRYLSGQIEEPHIAIYADLRTIGSPEGLFAGEAIPDSEKTARLLVDLLGLIHEEILEFVIDDDDLLGNAALTTALDEFVRGVTAVRVEVVEVEEEDLRGTGASSTSEGGVTISPSPSIYLGFGSEKSTKTQTRRRELRRGPERLRMNFSEVGRALRKIAAELDPIRIWILLDEWSSVPPSSQPLLGEFLIRCLLPLPTVTVKIGAIEQQSSFRGRLEDGTMVGIELGVLPIDLVDAEYPLMK